MKSTTQRWDKGLYLVSTPIGNLADISFRAVEALKQADVIICEDTRMTRKLCAYYAIKTPLRPYHDHTTDAERARILEMLREGKRVALVSDAGTPMVSDPGYKLVSLCAAEEIDVIPVPGANAVLPGLQLSALPCDRFYFGGFLPAKAKARQDTLREVKDMPVTMVFYETATRIKAALTDIASVLGVRPVAVVREITKLYEEALRGSAEDILALIAAGKDIKGEIVLVIGGAGEGARAAATDSLDDMLRHALGAQSLKDAVAAVMAATGLPRRDVYRRALEIQAEQ